MRENDMRSGKAIAAVILIFLLGAATGGLTAHLIYQKRVEGMVRGGPGAMSDMILKRMDRDLKLDSSQREAIARIIQETHGEMRQIRQQFRPQTRRILAASEERIRVLLRPDQKEVFQRLIEKRRQQWEENGERPHPEGTPPGDGPHFRP
jgi:Spy/CpxP family protein refolding chaperone